MPVKTLQPKRILAARLHAGMTQEDVAFRLRQHGIGASGKQVSRWENGGHAPRARVVPALAEVLGVQLDELYGEDDDEEADPAVALDLGLFDRAVRALAEHGAYDLAAELPEER